MSDIEDITFLLYKCNLYFNKSLLPYYHTKIPTKMLILNGCEEDVVNRHKK